MTCEISGEDSGWGMGPHPRLLAACDDFTRGVLLALWPLWPGEVRDAITELEMHDHDGTVSFVKAASGMAQTFGLLAVARVFAAVACEEASPIELAAESRFGAAVQSQTSIPFARRVPRPPAHRSRARRTS